MKSGKDPEVQVEKPETPEEKRLAKSLQEKGWGKVELVRFRRSGERELWGLDNPDRPAEIEVIPLASVTPEIIPGDPEEQAVFSKNVEAMRPEIEAGNGVFLMAAVSQCFHSGIPVPDWLKVAFSKAIEPVSDGRVKSWDEALGKPLQCLKRKKGAHPKSFMESFSFACKVYFAVRTRMKELSEKKKNGTLKFGERMFSQICAEVGEKLLCGTRQVKELYRDINRLNSGVGGKSPEK